MINKFNIASTKKQNEKNKLKIYTSNEYLSELRKREKILCKVKCSRIDAQWKINLIIIIDNSSSSGNGMQEKRMNSENNENSYLN